MNNSRVVVWFSCGAASVVAAKLAIEKYRERACVVYCDMMDSEHLDNARCRRKRGGEVADGER